MHRVRELELWVAAQGWRETIRIAELPADLRAGIPELAEKETIEVRYYISTFAVSVKRFAHAIRSHWGIENTCHWSLDITYREDESRIQNKHMREDFAWLRRLTLSLLKQHPGRESVAMKRRSCGWSDDFMLEVLTGAAI